MNEFCYIFFSIYLIFYKALSIIIIAALSAIGGALPLIGLFYIYFKYRKSVLEKYLTNYDRDIRREEENLVLLKEILKNYKTQGITLSSISNLYTELPKKIEHLSESERLFILNNFQDNQNKLWDSEQKINNIQRKIDYIKKLNFKLFIGTFLDKKYFLDIKY